MDFHHHSLSHAGHTYSVDVVETDAKKRAAAAADGFPVRDKSDALRSADVVLGTTGTTILDPNDFALLRDGAVLVSASSSSVEFGTAEGSGVKADVTPDVGGDFPDWAPYGFGTTSADQDANPHKHRTLSLGEKRFVLARSGFPINLTGAEDPIRASHIQLTRSLPLLGMIQAEREMGKDAPAPGLVPLDPAGQRFIAETFMDSMRADPTVPPYMRELLEEAFLRAKTELDRS